MANLIKHIKETHPSCHCIRLTVHPKNEAGKSFYTRLGFSDNKILSFGEPTYSIYI